MDLMNNMFQQYSSYVDAMMKTFNYGVTKEGDTAGRVANQTINRVQAFTDIAPSDEMMEVVRTIVGNYLSLIQRMGLLTIETAGRNQQVVSAALARIAGRATEAVRDTAEEFEEDAATTLHSRGRTNTRHAHH